MFTCCEPSSGCLRRDERLDDDLLTSSETKRGAPLSAARRPAATFTAGADHLPPPEITN